jgi:hypothetical protein
LAAEEGITTVLFPADDGAETGELKSASRFARVAAFAKVAKVHEGYG